VGGFTLKQTNPYLGKMEECQCMVVGSLGLASGAAFHDKSSFGRNGFGTLSNH